MENSKSLKNVIIVLLLLALACMLFYNVANPRPDPPPPPDYSQYQQKIDQLEKDLQHARNQRDTIEIEVIRVVQGKDSIINVIDTLPAPDLVDRFDSLTGPGDPSRLTADSLVLTTIPRTRQATQALTEIHYVRHELKLQKLITDNLDSQITLLENIVISEREHSLALAIENRRLKKNEKKQDKKITLLSGGVILATGTAIAATIIAVVR